MRARFVLVLAALLVAPAAALAQYAPPPPPPQGGYYPPPPSRPAGPADTGLNLSARLGYGAPFGDITNDLSFPFALKDVVPGKIPIWLELGARFNRHVWGGVFLELAPASIDSRFCDPSISCSAGDFRFGVDLQFHSSPRAPVDPWFGFGLAYEVMHTRIFNFTSDPNYFGGNDWTFSGFEFPLLEGGVDFALSPNFSLGPYVSVSLGQFTHANVDVDGGPSVSYGLNGQTWHGWVQLGVKGTIKL